jgi:acetolactate synthase-1/2/3 large subunit
MQSIQRVVVDGSDAIVMAESGNAFAWASQELRFLVPNRYRVSTGYGSMGHFVTGVVGAALARGGKAVAIVGDGSMLMNSEVSTAAQHAVPAVWIVLNDGRYSMVEQGMRLFGCTPVDATFPQADFAAIGRAMGADGMRVSSEAELDAALERAMHAEGPFIVDVIMTCDEASPLLRRAKSLMRQTSTRLNRSTVASPELTSA